MIRRTLIPLLLILVSATTALSAERLVLENGVVVIHDRRPTAPAVSLSAYVRAGSVNEPESMYGVSHFVEHMMFRATGRRPEGGSEREVWRVGGQMTAFTHEDYTEYGILVPSEHFALAKDILSDALMGASFLPGEVEEERVVILEEIRKRAGDPEIWAFDELQEFTFAPHPYGGHLAGTEPTIGELSRQDLHRYYLRTYRPERCTLVLVGDFDPEVALSALAKAFGTWRVEGTPIAAPPALPPRLGHYQELTLKRTGASPTLLLSMTFPAYRHSDYLPGRFFREVLVGWLVQRLVIDRRVALAADAFHTPLRLGNQLRIRLNLPSPEGAEAARDALLELLLEFSDPEFEYLGIPEIAANYQARETLLTEDFGALAPVIGRAAIWGYYHEDGYPEHLAADDRYARITAEDLRRVAREWLRPENMRMLFLLPEAADAPDTPSLVLGADPARRPAMPVMKRIPARENTAITPPRNARPPRDSEAGRTVLANGLRLIHLERTGAPVVSGAIVLPAGSRFDPEGKEGLAALTMRALSLATVGDPGGEYRWTIYAFGNDRAYSVGRDTAKVAFTVPKDDTAAAIRLFAEIIRNPAFTAAAIEEARGRLLTDVRRATSRVSSSAGAAFRGQVLGESPYAHEHKGSVASLTAITRDDVIAFFRRHYDPAGAVVSLVGEIAPRTARRLVERSLGLTEKSEWTAPPGPKSAPPEPAVRTLEHPSGRSYLILGSSAPAIADPARADTDLLRLALGWQVFHEFTDVLSIAYSAGAFYDIFGGAAAFGLYVSTSPSRIEETRTALLRIIDTARVDGFPTRMVEDARGSWLGGFALGTVKSRNTAIRLAVNESVGAGFDAVERIRQRIEKITAEELSDACRRLMAKDRLVEIRVN